MSFWRNVRETGTPYDAADALFERAVSLSREPRRIEETDRCLDAAINGYRDVIARTSSIEAKRRLAKALWRKASLTSFGRGQHGEALVPGEEALEVGRELLQTVAVSHVVFDEIVQEVSGAMNDIAQICFAAGRPRERERLLHEAAAVARRSPGFGGRQALGTALHNLAQHQLHDTDMRGTSPCTHGDVVRATLLAERAFEIRKRLCDEPGAEPYVSWELASSAVQLGKLLCKHRHQAAGVQVLRAGYASLRHVTGGPVAELRDQLAGAIADAGGPPPSVEEDVFPDRKLALLSQGASVLLELIGQLEADDRISALISLWFPDAWRAQHSSARVPTFEDALHELTERGLVTVRTIEGLGQYHDVDYLVERCVRARIPDDKARDICIALARRWVERFEGDRRVPKANPVRSGIGAAVYARRLGEFQAAFDLLEHSVLGLACERGEGEGVLIHMQISADASGDRALIERFDRSTETLAQAHRVEGAIDEALRTAAFGLDYALHRGLDASRIARWRELRLEFLYLMGRHDEVLEELDSFLKMLDTSATGASVGLAIVREAALHHGAGAAKALRRWQKALDLNGAIVRSLEDRGATATEIAAKRMLDYAALLELGNGAEADSLLRGCQALFESSQDRVSFAIVLASRGIVASRQGDRHAAAALKRRSLEIFYQAGESLGGSAHAHDIYANELLQIGEDPERVGLHWLAAAALYALTGASAASAAVIEKIARLSMFHIPETVEAFTVRIARDGFPVERILRSIRHERASGVIATILSSLRHPAPSR